MKKGPLTLVQPANPITLIVLPKQIVKVGLASPNLKVKVGQRIEVAIKLSRTTELGGDFKLELVLPANVKGVRAEPLTFSADRKDGTLIISTTSQAAVGTINNAILRATTMIGGSPVTQDTKIVLNVTK